MEGIMKYRDNPSLKANIGNAMYEIMVEYEEAINDPKGLYKGRRLDTTLGYAPVSFIQDLMAYKKQLAQRYAGIDDC
jgi:hypothetical protein